MTTASRKKEKKLSIVVRESVHRRLGERGRKIDTYEDIVVSLLDSELVLKGKIEELEGENKRLKNGFANLPEDSS